MRQWLESLRVRNFNLDRIAMEYSGKILPHKDSPTHEMIHHPAAPNR